ncbi:MAG: hypothetical protein N2559_03120 [Anaerolineae bacterium]|nr:hypothetical protein [Anaerolineae bacterium]
MTDNARLIRASEIGEYVFCRRAWWLHHVQGLQSAHHAQMEHGIMQHSEHGRAVQRADTLTRAAIVLGVLALFFAAMLVLAVLVSAF